MTYNEFEDICSKAASEMDDLHDFAEYVTDMLQSNFEGPNEIAIVGFIDHGPAFTWKRSTVHDDFEWQGSLKGDSRACVIAFNQGASAK